MNATSSSAPTPTSLFTPEQKLILRRYLASALHYSGLLKLQQAPSWRILMYHRVINPEEVSYPLQAGMYVRPSTFAMQMEHLKSHARVVPIEELVHALEQKKPIPARTVAITFDDGWKDNFENALPVLKEFGLPASVFVATAYIGTGETFWTDKVSYALLQLRKEKQYLEAVIKRIEETETLDPGIAAKIVNILRITAHDFFSESLDSFLEYMKKLQHSDRKTTANLLSTLAKEFTTARIERSFLSWDEISQMLRSQITFGSHTHQHAYVPELSEAQIKDEFDNSLYALRSHDVPASKIFCFPGGYVSEHAESLLLERGITSVLTTAKEFIRKEKMLYLPRIGIHEDISNTTALFAARLWWHEIF